MYTKLSRHSHTITHTQAQTCTYVHGLDLLAHRWRLLTGVASFYIPRLCQGFTRATGRLGVVRLGVVCTPLANWGCSEAPGDTRLAQQVHQKQLYFTFSHSKLFPEDCMLHLYKIWKVESADSISHFLQILADYMTGFITAK